jgi:hypothetical protein
MPIPRAKLSPATITTSIGAVEAMIKTGSTSSKSINLDEAQALFDARRELTMMAGKVPGPPSRPVKVSPGKPTGARGKDKDKPDNADKKSGTTHPPLSE